MVIGGVQVDIAQYRADGVDGRVEGDTTLAFVPIRAFQVGFCCGQQRDGGFMPDCQGLCSLLGVGQRRFGLVGGCGDRCGEVVRQRANADRAGIARVARRRRMCGSVSPLGG